MYVAKKRGTAVSQTAGGKDTDRASGYRSMRQYTLPDFQPVDPPEVWSCPSCGEYESESYGGTARHHHYCSDSGNHFLHEYYGDRLATLYRSGISRNSLAERLGVDRKTMTDALRSLGVELRDTSEAAQVWYNRLDEEKREAALYGGQDEAAKVLEEWREENPDHHHENAIDNLPEITHGQDHPSWRGGKSLRLALARMYGDRSWGTIRKDVRERYSECPVCGESPDDESLDVHHILPLLCGGDNGEYNLIPLCQSCHNTVEAYTRSIPEIQPVFVE